MKRAEAILAMAMAVSLTGCVLRGKQPTAKAAPPPPQPVVTPAPPAPPAKLSIPQTNVELPPPQPVNPEALAQVPPPDEPPPATTAPSRPRRTPPTPPRTETTAPGPVTPPAQTVEPPDRGPIQEIVPPTEQTRIREETANRKKEIQAHLAQVRTRGLKRSEKATVDRITFFLKESDAAETRGDWRGANELAGIGLALARELTGGK